VSALVLFYYWTTFRNFFGEYWPGGFFREYWPVVVLGLLLLSILGLSGYTLGASAIGFGPHVVKETTAQEFEGGRLTGKLTKETTTEEKQRYRTLWDWLTVLTISAVIAAVALTFTWSQAEQQRYVQDQQARDAALLAYLDKMSELILDRPLLATSDEEDITPEELEKRDAARDVARARTLVALLVVGPERKRDIVRFLYEADLIKSDPDNPGNRVVDLTQANLTDADLSRMPLRGIDLRGANLSDGFDEPNTRGANLRKADLRGASLEGAKLKSANLEGAKLQDAKLESANLEGAKLQGAILQDGATAETNSELLNQQGAHLKGATMPDGQPYEERQAWMMPN
jgi:uncharacterized protein YjbI with pentapeptide repeats